MTAPEPISNYFLRGRIDGADFKPEDGGPPFLRVSAPRLGQIAALDVVVIDAATYDQILAYVWQSLGALMDEGIGDRGGPLSNRVLLQAADRMAADVCARWDLGLVSDADHGSACSCYSALRWRGQDPDAVAGGDAAIRAAAAAAAAEEARQAQERAEGRRVPWEETGDRPASQGKAWSFDYQPVTDGTEHPADRIVGDQRWRPHGEAVLINTPGFPPATSEGGWT